MSGLEALGLACNVMQLISFAHETWNFCSEVYNGRSPDRSLRDNAEAMFGASQEVTLQLALLVSPAGSDTNSSSGSPTGNLSLAERQLADLARKCNKAARELRDEALFLCECQAAGNLLSVMKTAIKTNWRRKRMQRLEKDLQNYRSAMETRLLERL